MHRWEAAFDVNIQVRRSTTPLMRVVLMASNRSLRFISGEVSVRFPLRLASIFDVPTLDSM